MYIYIERERTSSKGDLYGENIIYIVNLSTCSVNWRRLKKKGWNDGEEETKCKVMTKE